MSIVRWIAYGWLGWITLVLCVAYPVYGGAALAVILALSLVLYRYRTMQRKAALAAYRHQKAMHYRNQRVLRAQTHPDRVFEEHASAWEKEFEQ